MTTTAQLQQTPQFESATSANYNAQRSQSQLFATTEPAPLLAGEVTLPDGRRLRKADPKNFRDQRMVDTNGNTVMTTGFLRQLCKENKLYSTPELNDKLYLHFKGTTIL
jgi:hypothetical protein